MYMINDVNINFNGILLNCSYLVTGLGYNKSRHFLYISKVCNNVEKTPTFIVSWPFDLVLYIHEFTYWLANNRIQVKQVETKKVFLLLYFRSQSRCHTYLWLGFINIRKPSFWILVSWPSTRALLLLKAIYNKETQLKEEQT